MRIETTTAARESTPGRRNPRREPGKDTGVPPMSMQYDAERLAELQRVLVTEYLELCADSDTEPNPDALRACAMLLAGAAELADPPSPTPAPESAQAPADEVFVHDFEASEIDAPLPDEQQAFERGRDIEYACNPPVDDE